MAYKWTPPPGYTSLEYKGKTYNPGQTVPITKEEALHMAKHAGHIFEEVPADQLSNVVPSENPKK